MRSNGVAHLGNDTFVAVTGDATENMFLVTSKLAEDRVAAYSLARRVHFTPRSDIASLPHHGTPSPTPTLLAEAGTEVETEAAAAVRDSPRHSLHASPNGQLLAAISTTRRRHYLIDMLSARVCEFATPDVVVAAAWHPAAPTHLLLLLSAGALLLFRAGDEQLGVLFHRGRAVRLAAVVRDLKDYVLSGDNAAPVDRLKDPRGRMRPPPEGLEGAAVMVTDSEAAPAAAETAVRLMSPPSPLRPSLGDECASKLSLDDREDGRESEGGAGAGGVGKDPMEPNDDSEAASNVSLQSARASKDPDALIGMCIIPASRSLPVMLLVLSRRGDVFSIKIDEDGAPTSLPKEYDGCVNTIIDKEYEHHRDTGPSPCVHYLVCGGVSGVGYEESPLVIGSTLLDEDVGRHVVFVMYNSGVLRGGWFCEPDLLCRDLMCRQMDFAIHLDSAISPSLSMPNIPSEAHLVGLYTCRNTTLIRYNESAFMCVWPVWSRSAAGWVYREEGEDGCKLVPVVSHDAAVPEPAVLRFPYDIDGASLGVGVNDILIFPEVTNTTTTSSSMAHEKRLVCPRSKVITVKIANLLLANMYARSENYTLSFETKSDDGKEEKNKQEEKKEETSLHRLLELTAVNYRQWLCRYPQNIIERSTTELAKGVQRVHEELLSRNALLRKREEELSTRVQRLQQRKEEISQIVKESQNVIRDAVVHRCGAEVFYAANDSLGKIHVLLNELEGLKSKQQKKVKVKSR